MIVTVPFVPGETNHRLGTTLSGTQFVLDARWNSRESAWYMDVRTDDGTAIRVGIKIVLGVLLGGRVVDASFPLGVFQAVDTTNTGTEAGINDLGARVQVYYYPFEDL